MGSENVLRSILYNRNFDNKTTDFNTLKERLQLTN